jgi:hypothetical protein
MKRFIKGVNFNTLTVKPQRRTTYQKAKVTREGGGHIKGSPVFYLVLNIQTCNEQRFVTW